MRNQELEQQYGDSIHKYEALLDEIDPEVIAEKIGEKHRVAFQHNTVDVEITDDKTFFHYLGTFYMNQCRLTGRNVPSFNDCVAEAKRYLGDSEMDAFRDSTKNQKEGFFGVCKKIFEALLREEESAYIKSIVRKHINIFAYDERENFAQYYCKTRLDINSDAEIKIRVMKIAQDIDKFIEFYVQKMGASR